MRYVEVEEEIEEEVPDVDASSPMADASFSATPSDDIDEEIREVFVEEVQDEIDNLGRCLPTWKADVNDFEKLKPIRRSFHTLKGSGRLVGALALGEFSWKVENMLNRVLDKTISAQSGRAVARRRRRCRVAGTCWPRCVAKARRSPISARIMDVADKIAAGEEAWVRSGATQRMKKVKRVVRRLVPVVDETATITTDTAPALIEPVAEPVELISSFNIEDAFSASPEQVAAHAGGDLDEQLALSAEPLPNIDPVLFEILKSEVATHLGVIDGYVDELRSAPTLPASEPLLRAVHTLNGAIAMVDIPVISHVLAPLEGYIKRLRADRRAPNAAGLAALAECSILVNQAITALEDVHPRMPNSDALAARVAELRDTLREPEMMHTLFALAEDEAQATETPATGDADAANTDADAANISASAAERTDPDNSEAAQVADAVPDHEAALFAAMESIELIDSSVPIDTAFSLAEPELASSATTETSPGSVGSDEDFTAAWLLQVAEEEAAAKVASAVPDAVSTIAAVAVTESADQASLEPTAEAPQPEEPELLSFEDLALAESGSIAEEQAEVAHIELDHIELDHIELERAESELAELERAIALHEAPALDVTTPIQDEVKPAATEPLRATVAQVPELPPLQDDAQPEGKLDLPDIDEDLLEIFVQEAADILDHSDSMMARLREAPQDRDLVTGLQRDLHTLKGGARMAGLAPIGDLSHSMESLLEVISENRRLMDRVTVESLERGFDRLHGLVQRVAKRQAIAMPEHAIARFEGLVSGELPVAAPMAARPTEVEPATIEPVTTPAIAVQQDEVTAEQPKQTASKPNRPPPRPLPVLEEEDTQSRAPQEMIRVRSDLLDSLVNYAGEVSIYRSRLEQQISTFRFNLVEFETTVSRLRDQLRKLEMETEAQILSRYQREAESSESSFDPLELDRFSQLQQLSRALAESVSDLVSIQGLLDDLTRQSETLLLQQSRVSSDLQEGLMRTRMVPFDSLVPSLRRTVRQAAQEVGKRAQLKVEGAQGEMDRNLLERMKAPFEHMLRNALAHGIETPEERETAGKSNRRHSHDPGQPRGDGSRAACVRRRQGPGSRRDPAQGHRARSAQDRCATVRSRSLRFHSRNRLLHRRARYPACRPRRRHGRGP